MTLDIDDDELVLLWPIPVAPDVDGAARARRLTNSLSPLTTIASTAKRLMSASDVAITGRETVLAEDGITSAVESVCAAVANVGLAVGADAAISADDVRRCSDIGEPDDCTRVAAIVFVSVSAA